MKKRGKVVTAVACIKVACVGCKEAIFGPHSGSALWTWDDCADAVEAGGIVCDVCETTATVPAAVKALAKG